MGLIPDEIIGRVLERCDIVGTISTYFPLRRAGRNFKACCPFHDEKTPSFVVNPDKQIFHCFGCGVGGNVINFVMRQERLEFPEAVRTLAQKVGIDIPEQGRDDSTARNLRQVIFKINGLAAEFFHQNLIAGSETAAKRAIAYLKKREVSFETVKELHLGFAPDKWDGLLEYLRKKDIPLNLVESSGLILAREKSEGYYDRFRNRIIFPIFDVKLQCIAFGARAMEENATAKYINSPETAVYTKGHHLYGLHLAKEIIPKEDSAVIVEGYMDFLMPFQAGVKNVVASLGTALTVEQIRLLRRFTEKVVMLYDADKAGEAATLRSLDLLIEEGMDVRVAVLAEGEDPDSFIRKYGVDLFKERLAQSHSVFDYKLQNLIRRFGLKTIESRAKIVGEILPTINKFQSEVVKFGYLKNLAEALAIPEQTVLAEYRKGPWASPVREIKAAPTQTLSTQQHRMVERKILKLLLEDPELIMATREQLMVSDFQDPKIKMIVAKMFELSDQGKDPGPANLTGCLPDPDVLGVISSLTASEEEFTGDKKKIHSDFIKRIQNDRMKSQRQILSQQIRDAETTGNLSRRDELLAQFNQLMKK